ncbi:MAG TPA: PaaI family thioesterase [Burkholderiales bacterium]|nr:PaaI family thioesterase [Burkholderiales bacterium]
MALIGASLATVGPSAVEITLPFREDLTPQKGFVHGGIIGMIADTACGYAAYSLMPAGCSLVTVEHKINILASATASLTARAEVYAQDGKHVATMQQTLMMLAGQPDHRE